MRFPPEGDGGGSGEGEGGDQTLLSGASGDGVNWYDPLPDDLKSADVVTKHKSLDTFVKSAIHASAMVGRDKVALPAKDDDPGWADVWNKLGRPEEAGGYELPPDVAAHESVSIPEETVGSFRERAHELGLSQRQMAGLYRWFMEDINTGAETQATQLAEGKAESIATLKREFGEAFDERLGMARAAVNQFGGQELAAVLNDTGLGDLADDQLYRSGATPGMRGRMTPEEAMADIAAKQKDLDFIEAYTEGDHPDHAAAVEEMTRLHQIAASA
jgi:hypothetical protein